MTVSAKGTAVRTIHGWMCASVLSAAEPSLARVLEAPELDEFFEELFSEPACCFDFKWFR